MPGFSAAQSQDFGIVKSSRIPGFGIAIPGQDTTHWRLAYLIHHYQPSFCVKSDKMIFLM